MIFIYAPTEAVMGNVQRIFYIMVPMGWLAMLSFLIIFIASILYLRSKRARWDTLSQSAAEIGVIATTLTLITGSMWARPVWGVWWTWEPRLTATLVLWLIYLAYFLVRSLAADEQRGATFAAVVGIVGFIDVPIIGLSTTLWRGMHPGTIILAGGLAPQMLRTLLVSLTAFTVMYVMLLLQVISIKNAETEVRRLKEPGG
ncbi:MAG: cytochrome c biogenesis protein CcsA [Chloroflexi bacterium]|nr:cytochrome c biogenesis protein CcsA [Chloroflexota bacterium]